MVIEQVLCDCLVEFVGNFEVVVSQVVGVSCGVVVQFCDQFVKVNELVGNFECCVVYVCQCVEE